MNIFAKLYRGWSLRFHETEALIGALSVLERSTAEVKYKLDVKLLIAGELLRRRVTFWER